MLSPASPSPMRKVQPFLISSGLADAVDAAIIAMASPMLPRVTIAAAARELLVLGCDHMGAELVSTRAVRWTSLHPTRGPRPLGKHIPSDMPDAPDDVFHQLSPIALPEALINRLHDLVCHAATATRSKVSIAMVMREALARGCVEYDRITQEVEAWKRAQAILSPRSGFPLATRAAVLASSFSSSTPSGRPAPRSQRPLKASKPKAATAAATTTQSLSSGRSRARTPRRATPRRTTTADDGDDGGDGHSHAFSASQLTSTARFAQHARGA